MAALLPPLAWLALCWGFLAAGGDADGERDPCRCLKWREVYASGRAVCGEFAELIRIFRPSLYIPPQKIKEAREHPDAEEYAVHRCEDWLHHFDSNECINVDVQHYSGQYELGELYDQTFCYVSGECGSLNGGRRLGRGDGAEELPERNISVKICKRGEDQLLREVDPLDMVDRLEQVHAAAPKSKLTFDFLIHESYRALGEPFTWPLIGYLWAHQDFKALPPKLQACMLRNEAILVLKSPTLKGLEDFRNFKLIHGWRLIHVDLDIREMQWMGKMKDGLMTRAGEYYVHLDPKIF